MSVATWFASGLEHHADELEAAARLSRLRAKRLGGEYAGAYLTIFSEAMAAAEKELRRGVDQLRSPMNRTAPAGEEER